MPIDFGKPFIGKNDHFLFDAIVGVGHVTVPVDNLSQLVQQKAEFSTHNPSLVGEAFRTVPTIVVASSKTESVLIDGLLLSMPVAEKADTINWDTTSTGACVSDRT